MGSISSNVFEKTKNRKKEKKTTSTTNFKPAQTAFLETISLNFQHKCYVILLKLKKETYITNYECSFV